MCHALIFDLGAGFLNGLSDHFGRGLFGLADRAHIHRHTKAIIHQPNRMLLATAEIVFQMQAMHLYCDGLDSSASHQGVDLCAGHAPESPASLFKMLTHPNHVTTEAGSRFTRRAGRACSWGVFDN